MPNKDVKPALTLEEQVALLVSRGLIINDPNYAINVLGKVNYYRLSAYSLGLRVDDVFNEGVTFEEIYQLYVFDTKLQHLLLFYIEQIEIALRTQIAYFLGIKYGPLSYLDKALFYDIDHYMKFIKDFYLEKTRQRNILFVSHHNINYRGQMPIWVAVELFTFGILSKFYGSLKKRYQKQFIKEHLKKPKGFEEYLVGWLRCLVEVRNICAHSGRIYNRILSSQPKIFPRHKNIITGTRRIFPVFIVIITLLNNYHESTNFITELKALVDEYPVVRLDFIGFPNNWEEVLNSSR